MVDDASVEVECVVDLSSAVESNEVGMESPVMASFDPSSSLASGQSVLAKVQICQASSQSSAQTDPSLKAHDYIGLCEVSSRAEASCANGQQQDMGVSLQETELRLGPPKAPAPAPAAAPASFKVGVPFQPKQGPSVDARECDAAGGQTSMVGWPREDDAFLHKIVRPCENPKEILPAREEGAAGMQKAVMKSESFKRRCMESGVEGWDLGMALPSQAMAHPQEEVGENKLSCISGRILEMHKLDSKEQLSSPKELAPLGPFEDDPKLLTKNASHQQQDVESTRRKQLKGQAEHGVFGLPQGIGSSQLQELGAAHKLWQAHMMVRAADGAHFAKSYELQPPQDLEISSGHFKRALDGMNGARILPAAPKPVTAGAKRVFSEAIGGNGAALLNGAAKIAASSEVMGVADSESKLFKQQLSPPVFSWGSSKIPLASWASDGAAPCEPLPSPGKTLLKGDASILPLKHCFEALPKKSLGCQGSPPELVNGVQDAQIPGEEDTTVSVPRAPVGWPPVQSFRKNSLPPPKPKKLVAPTLPPVAPQLTQSECLFVKVYMDGLPIGRKVDLRTINNYDKLSLALEEMFKGFMNGQSGDKGQGDLFCTKEKKLNYQCNSEYVIAYEDKDGDLMLVGDVPWGMFIVTVKRLRIMKGSGAIGLAPRPSDKAKCS